MSNEGPFGSEQDQQSEAVSDVTEAIKTPIKELLSEDGGRKVPYRLIVATVWITLGSLLLLALAFALVITLEKLLFWMIMAVFLALVLDPLVRRMERRGIGRGIGIFLVVFLAIAIAAALGAELVAPIAKNASKLAGSPEDFLRNSKGPLFRLARKLHLEGQLAQAGPALQKTLGQLPGILINSIKSIANAAVSTAIIVILSLFLLAEGPNIVNGLMGLVPDSRKDSFRRIGRAISVLVSGYMTGVFLLAALNGIITFVVLAITGVPFALPLALWAGIIDILPIVGGLLGIVPAALFALSHSTSAAAVVVGTMFIYQQVKNHFLYPVVIGKALKLNALLILISVLIGAELYGVAGAVLSIPVAGTIQAIVAEMVRSIKGEPPLAETEGVGAAVESANAANGGILRRLHLLKKKA